MILTYIHLHTFFFSRSECIVIIMFPCNLQKKKVLCLGTVRCLIWRSAAKRGVLPRTKGLLCCDNVSGYQISTTLSSLLDEGLWNWPCDVRMLT